MIIIIIINNNDNNNNNNNNINNIFDQWTNLVVENVFTDTVAIDNSLILQIFLTGFWYQIQIMLMFRILFAQAWIRSGESNLKKIKILINQ